ncbi:MAG: acyl carrier protein [Planctomycetes bacterium]|nr:acyl carrier protein [Planctomycetota bacterium]
MPATGVEQAVKDVLAEVAKVDPSTLRREMDLASELGMDSPRALELLCRLEEKLGLEIPDEAPPRLVTVGELVDYLGALVGKSAGAPAAVSASEASRENRG